MLPETPCRVKGCAQKKRNGRCSIPTKYLDRETRGTAACAAFVPADRYKVVTAIVEHPLRPGIVGQVAKWPTGVYTLVVGHTHYTLPQPWAAAQVALTPEVAHE